MSEREFDSTGLAAPWGGLPSNIRILFITGSRRRAAWLADVLAADIATAIQYTESIGVAAGIAKLRDEVFDAVIINHEDESLDALELLDAIRASGSDEQPMIVIGQQSECQFADLCFESGADSYVCVNTTTTRTLIWQLARAMERHDLLAENRQLRQDRHHRLKLEHDEATSLLRQQHTLVSARISKQPAIDFSQRRSQVLSAILDGEPIERTMLPSDWLLGHYRELLQAYVVMGAGNLTDELNRLAATLVDSRASAADVMAIHLQALEEMICDLGNRSARHVMNRADLLILEVMMNLTETYRKRSSEQTHIRDAHAIAHQSG